MNRKSKTDFLIDAIGEIDEHFLSEAENYIPKERRHTFRKLAIVGVCIALTLSLMLTLLISTLTRDKAPESDSRPTSSDVAPDVENTELDFFVAMSDIREETQGLIGEFERDMLFDGTARLIWKYNGETDYRTCSLSLAQSDAIKRSMQSQKDFEEVGTVAPASDLEGFWICFGDGLVYSPCLKNSNGNVGYGTLFDYDAELIPSEEFTSLISNAIKQ